MGVVGLAVSGGLRAAEAAPTSLAASPVVWALENTRMIGRHEPLVLGAPESRTDPAMGKILHFNGSSDGVVLPAIPFAGWSQFTIELLFQPEAGGLPEQRFMHVEDPKGSRAMMETRLTPDNQWYLDTFLLSGASSLALIDKTKLHPTGQWFWVALRYDGKQMSSFVNGVKELAGPVNFAPIADGKISLGVRQNRVFWFKGAMREVRFSPTALSEAALQRVPAK